MPGPQRDLALADPWNASLARSRERRARSARGRRARAGAHERGGAAGLLASSRGLREQVRDLAAAEPWELSLGRSRARRRAAELHFVPSSSRAKRASLGALAALSVGPTASLADGGSATATGSASGAPPTSTEHTIVLSLESEGRQVKLLQRALGAIKVDGVFGPETEEAVRRFQTQRGLAVDGVVGQDTGAALRNATATQALAAVHSEVPGEAPAQASDAVLLSPAADEAQGAAQSPAEEQSASSAEGAQAGETGGSAAEAPSAEVAAVRRLQSALHLKADGEFGPETAAAIRRLQARNHVGVDGIAGPATWRLIGVHAETTLTPPPKALPQPAHATEGVAGEGGSGAHEGAEGPGSGAQAGGGGGGTRRLQAALHLSADGEFGPETAAAIRRLQARNGLTVDSVVGPATWSLIGVHGEGTLSPPRAAVAPRSSRSSADSESGGEASEGGSSSREPSSGGGEGGESSSAVSRVIAAGNEIATRPYVYGGGHGSFHSTGYDCSGSVSYALHGGGLISSPEDSTSLESYGAAGPGKHITIYANSEHTFMVVDGKRFDTSAQHEGGSRWSSSTRSTSGYVVRHPTGY